MDSQLIQFEAKRLAIAKQSSKYTAQPDANGGPAFDVPETVDPFVKRNGPISIFVIFDLVRLMDHEIIVVYNLHPVKNI